MPFQRRLRFILSRSNPNVLQGLSGLCGELQLAFGPEVLLALEVLLLDVQCNLTIHIDPTLSLQSLVAIPARHVEQLHLKLQYCLVPSWLA